MYQLGGYFWMRLIFKSINFAKQIALHNVVGLAQRMKVCIEQKDWCPGRGGTSPADFPWALSVPWALLDLEPAGLHCEKCISLLVYLRISTFLESPIGCICYTYPLHHRHISCWLCFSGEPWHILDVIFTSALCRAALCDLHFAVVPQLGDIIGIRWRMSCVFRP